MQQHDSNALIQEEEQRFNKSESEKVVLRYRSTSPLYYQEGQENEEFEQRVQNFEPLIHYVVEQKASTQGIIISKGVESVLVIKQEIVVLLRVEPIVVEGVPTAVIVKYSEP